MYTKYFELTEEPFSIATNPRFLYMSARHREALAHLLYGIRSDSGFVLLTGEVGTGKTTVCRCLLEQLPENTDVAFILNPKVSVIEMLSSICDELHIVIEGQDSSVKTYVDAINRYLLKQHAAGRNTVVIIDEAQNLSLDVLEQLRLLTNLETNELKLMRIILLGQPELEIMLSRPELRQLEQRITARYHLGPLDRSEIGAYVSHRLAVAGRSEPVFSPRVIANLYHQTQGIPRLINVICDRAMMGAYVKSKHKVNGSILNKAAREVKGRMHQPGWFSGRGIIALVMLAAVATTAALYYTDASYLSSMMSKLSKETVPEVAAQSPVDVMPEVSPEETVETTVVELSNSIPAKPQWPDAAIARGDSQAVAYAGLFKQWDLTLPADNSEPCKQAITWGFRCYSGFGNLGSLASNDRPVILTLVDNEGRQYQATLLKLDYELATLAFTHGIETVTVKDLEARWRGHYQLLWRATPQGYALLGPGSLGSSVTWLTESLIVAGIKPLPVLNNYNAEVVAGVKAFQRKHGLIADGIAGRMTLIRLNSATDKTIPRLSQRGSD